MKALLKILIAWLVLLLLLWETGESATYYVATTGNDSTGTGSSVAPWATFAKAMTVLIPGDTLNIRRGTYYQYMHVTVSGNSSNYITIQADPNDPSGNADGYVYIDQTQWNGSPNNPACAVDGQSYINMQGLICVASPDGSNFAIFVGHKSSNDATASYVNFRRMSAYTGYGTAGGGGGHIAVINVDGHDNTGNGGLSYAHHILFEDTIIYTPAGSGYISFDALSAEYITVRRTFAYTADPCVVFYQTENSIAENNICKYQVGGYPYNAAYGVQINASSACYGANNSLIGNIVVGNSSGNGYTAAVSLSDRYNCYNVGDSAIVHDNFGYNFANYGAYINNSRNLTFHNNTFVETRTDTPQAGGAWIAGLNLMTWGNHNSITMLSGQTINANVCVSNNSNLNGSSFGYVEDTNAGGSITVARANNDFYNAYHEFGGSDGPTAASGEVTTQPTWNSSYGTIGQYLTPPTNMTSWGATITCQTVNGSTGSNALFPWPMDDRIQRELGSSGTIAALGFNGATSLLWNGTSYSGLCGGGSQINGYCGTASGQTFTSAPSINLCASGSATTLSGSGPWYWGCNGSNGGTSTASNACVAYYQAQYTVTPSIQTGCVMNPSSPVQVNSGNTQSFTVGTQTGFTINNVWGCGGTWGSSPYVTAAITANCMVSCTVNAASGITTKAAGFFAW
jgi:hypothetical protein